MKKEIIKNKFIKVLPHLMSNLLALIVIGALEAFRLTLNKEVDPYSVFTNVGIMLLANTLVLNSSIN